MKVYVQFLSIDHLFSVSFSYRFSHISEEETEQEISERNQKPSLTAHCIAGSQWETVRGKDPNDNVFYTTEEARTWELFEPVATCSDETRIGQLGDGGKCKTLFPYCYLSLFLLSCIL